MRAKIFADRGLISLLSPQDLSAASMSNAMLQALGKTTPLGPEAIPALRGVATATQGLLQLLSNGSGHVKSVIKHQRVKVRHPDRPMVSIGIA